MRAHEPALKAAATCYIHIIHPGLRASTRPCTRGVNQAHNLTWPAAQGAHGCLAASVWRTLPCACRGPYSNFLLPRNPRGPRGCQ